MKQASHEKAAALSKASRVDPLLPARLAGKVSDQVEAFADQ